MSSPRKTLIAAIVLAVAAGPVSMPAARAQQTPAATTMPSMPSMPAASSPAGMANMSAMTKMNDAMGKGSMTGDPDRDFVGMMTPHHQGAIEMAQVELKYGKDPVLRKMATQIVAAQNKEIKEMAAWQSKHPKR